MFGSLFEDTIRIIKRWNPGKKFSNEKGYSNDLTNFLRYEFNENQSPLTLGIPSRVSVIKEDGRGLCDIAINRKIGIELKKELKSKSQIDRLAGQIIDYKKDYQNIIIVLVGTTKKAALESLKDKIFDLTKNDIGLGFNQGSIIKVIDKASEPNKRKKPSSPFGFGFV